MGWTETCAMHQRMRFVLMVEKRVENFAEICRRFGVSRKTGYKWLARYLAEGPAGLADQSRPSNAGCGAAARRRVWGCPHATKPMTCGASISRAGF